MYPEIFIGPVQVSAYWLMASLGVVAGFVMLFINLKTFPRKEKQAFLLFAAIIFLPFVLGSRLGYILESAIFKYPSEGFSVFGGVSLWWGLMLACAAAIAVAPALKVNVWKAADLFAMSIAIGGVFARVGCLLRGCCFGVPCGDDFPLGTFFSSYSYSYNVFPGRMLHPTQLYSSFAWFIIFITLIALNKKRHFDGQLFLIMAFLHSLFSYFIDFLRYHPVESTFIPSKLIPLTVILLSSIIYIILRKFRSRLD